MDGWMSGTPSGWMDRQTDRQLDGWVDGRTDRQTDAHDLCSSGKWHLGLHCGHTEDFCHHPLSHGFDHFYGLPLTNLRDCKLGAGSVFGSGVRLLIFVPLQVLAITLVTLAALKRLGLIRVPPLVFGVLLAAAAGLLGLLVAFLHTYRPLNCFLMRGRKVTQQPLVYDKLTQRFTDEATGFMKR